MNYDLDAKRAEAYEQSKIENSGVICSEDLVLKDGITHAWYNAGNKTVVYNPDDSIISSTGSQVGPNYGINNDNVESSFLSNSSSYFRNAGTGSFDHSMSMDAGDQSMDSENQQKV